MEIIAYPVFIAQLGGAEYVRHNYRSAWVKLAERTIRVPFRELRLCIDDGLRVAEVAKTYAYRNH